jgi:asparagine synthase (glutamine-hydrolysing)
VCGVVAFHSQKGGLSEETLGAALSAIRHRGPDDQGLWLAPDRQVGLGHVRLGVVDLAGGRQPMASDDGALQIAVSGDFCDYQALAAELNGQGPPLRTRTGSEIALRLYDRLGTAFVERLRGEFAFVLWNGRTRTLIAARDRFGIKPLFYTVHDGTLFVASEVKALLAAGVPRAWDKEAVAQFLAFGASHPGRCLFGNVFQVPPGHYLLAREDTIRTVRYWDLDYPTPDNGREWLDTEAAYIEQFGALLEDAVRTRLRADGPLCVHLSGGVDSSSVLGFAAKHGANGLGAFTARFDRPGFDEGAVAEETCRHWGVEWHPVRLSEEALAEHFCDAVWHSETACSNFHGVAKYILSRATRECGYKVALTGEGSDDILGGYSFFGADAPAQGRVFTPRKRPPGIAGGDDGAEKKDDAARIPSWIGGSLSLTMRHAALFDPDFASAFPLAQVQAAVLKDLESWGALEGRSLLHRSIYFYTRTMLPNYAFQVAGDRVEMAHSVEGRLPYLDHKLVDLVVRMPVSLMLKSLLGKQALREAARSVLTETVYAGKKRPFWAPLALLGLGGALEACINEILRGEGLGRLPFFDRAKVLERLDSVPSMDQGDRALLDPVLMRIASLCVLQERFGL